jgi:hypothetical protein
MADDPRFSDDLLDLLQSGLDIIVATRDAALAPECTTAMGVRAHRDRRTLTVYLPKEGAEPTLKNLADNGEIAVTFCRPSDHKTVQLKGRATSVTDSRPEDRELQERYRAALAEQFAIVGVPRAITRRMCWWPSVAIDVEVREAFTQTPGPRAGAPLARWGAEELGH